MIDSSFNITKDTLSEPDYPYFQSRQTKHCGLKKARENRVRKEMPTSSGNIAQYLLK